MSEPDWPTADVAARSRLYSPLALTSTCTLPARTWVPAMVPWRATEDGFVTPDLHDWYGRLADGRPAALVIEATGVRDVPSGPLLRIHHDRFVPGLRALVDTIRARSAGETRVFVQLIDFLAIKRRPEPARYFREFLVLRPAHRVALARHLKDDAWLTADDVKLRSTLAALDEAAHPAVLSARELDDLHRGFRERVTDVQLRHIEDLPAVLPVAFTDAALRAQEAGFDGVELHAAHAYTLASFLSATNTRTDGFGTAREGRLRVPLAVLAAVKAAVDPGFAVGIRFLGDEVIAGGTRIDDACAFAVAFAQAGADFLSLSKGGKFEDARVPRIGEAVYPYTGPSGLECIPTTRLPGGPLGRHLPLARAVRAAVRAAALSTPIVAAGGLHTFRLAEEALERGDLDIVAAARQSLADPDWWQKMRRGHGDTIRACSHTNYCEGLDQKHKKVTCRLWDREPIAPGEPCGQQGGRRLVAPPPRTENNEAANRISTRQRC